MKRYFIIWLLVGISSFAFAQTITIKDQGTGMPLEMATLASHNPVIFATTNVKGQADISGFKKAIVIEIRMLGYKPLIMSYKDLEKAQFNVNLVHTGITMDEVVISANRWGQTSKEIPQKISVLTTKDAQLTNPQTSADLLGLSGEVFIQKSQQGGGSPMIRGFATNRLLYSIDGVRMNTAIFRSGNIQNVISIDPFSTEKAEVLFGPGSVIYGSDAIGGVMSFQTLTPQLSLTDKPLVTGKAITRYSSANNEKTAHFDVNIGWKKWAAVTSFSSNDFGDLKMGSDGPEEYLRRYYVRRQDSTDVIVTNEDPRIQTPSGYSQINLMQKIRFKPSDKWDFQYAYHFSETSEYSRYDRHIRFKKGLPRYGEWAYGPQKWIMNQFTVQNISSNKIYDQMTFRLAQQKFEESRIDRDIHKKDRHIRIEEVDAYSANLDFTKAFGNNNRVFYGVELVQNDVTSIGIDQDIVSGTSAPGPSRYPQSTWASYAAYLSYHHNFTEKFLMQTGVRYNIYKLDGTFDTTFYHFPFTTAEINNGALTGTIGFVYKPTKKWAISLNASSGFRSPNVDDVGKVFDSEPGSVVVPNPELNAEYVYNAELGIARLLGEIAKIDFTVYYTYLDNAMVRRDFTLNGFDSIMYEGSMSKVQAIQNAANATVYGVQAGFDLKLPSGFGFSTDFNYQHGEEVLDDGSTSPSRHAPPWFGISRLMYSYDKLDVQFYAMYSGKKDFEDLPLEEQGKTEIYAIDNEGNPCSPGWYTINFKAMYQLSDIISVSAGLENISDQRYRPYSSGIVAPGRNFVLSFKAAF